jgi:hypothetical protein
MAGFLLVFTVNVTGEPSAFSCCIHRINADQTTLWQGSYSFRDSASAPNTTFSYTHQFTYNNTYTRHLVLSGFKFEVRNNLDIQADIVSTSPTVD